MDSVIEFSVNKADEFWNLLSPTNQLFNEPYELIFRGQSNANWALKPSVFRNNNNPEIEFGSKITTSDKQIFSELEHLRKFVDYCDKRGIALSWDSHKFREEHIAWDSRMMSKYFHNPSMWPHSDIYELMAVAQHYGLPTRLLDWSRFSFVAIYFAASDAISKIDNFDEWKNQRLAVWVLNIKNKNKFSSLEIVNVPSGYNKNLANQAGCFTLLRQSAERNQPFIGSVCHDEYPRVLSTNSLMKISVPVTEAARLLELCDLHFVSASTLFPDYSGAAKAVKDDLNKIIFNNLKNEYDLGTNNQSVIYSEKLYQ